MGIDQRVALSVEALALDVFDVAGDGQAVESLTAGHGMTELGASTGCSCTCSCSNCSCSIID